MHWRLLALGVLLWVALGMAFATDPTPAPQPYRRADWPHWASAGTADNGCRITVRQRVLLDESVIPVRWDGCRIVAGLWHDRYSGAPIRDPKLLQVDHVVPLAAASRSGGCEWTREAKRTYANYLGDPEHLIAVSARENMRKSDQGPDGYLPPVSAAEQCRYAQDFVRIKREWQLAITPAEWQATREVCDEE